MNQQLPLIPEETALDRLDPRVRTTILNDEQYVSAYDILEFHGNKKNPRQSWKYTVDYMEKQGASLSPFLGQHQFPSKDGKLGRATPVINLNGFLRLVQSAEVPEWEPIRQWLADTGEQSLKSKAQRERESAIGLHQKKGYGETPEILRLIAYNAELSEYEKLKRMFAQVVDNPDYAALNNAEYMALFGMLASQLKKAYGDVSIRGIAGTVQLETMAYAEKRLREALSNQQEMTNERAIQIIDVVIAPLGVYLRGYTQLMNVDLVTGKPLLGDGKRD